MYVFFIHAFNLIQEQMELAWDDAYDEVIASDGENVWHGRQFYDYLFHEVLVLDDFHRDSSIPFNVQQQFEHDRFSSHNPDKTVFIRRESPDKAELTVEEREKQDENLWMEPLKGYFNEEIQYISVKTLIYDIFTTNLNMESKAGFLASVYGEQREGFFMSEYTDNSYGKCKISRDKDGIAISYPRADGGEGEKRVDYRYCADLILHMIEENDYLTEGIFERFREAPEAFAAMPWFMEIYHEYKERMLQEPDFEAVSIDGQEEEAAEEWQAVENGQEEIPEAWQKAESGQEETAETQQEETAEIQQGQEAVEHVEGEILDHDGSVAKVRLYEQYKAGTITREDYVARIEKGKIRMEELEQIKSEAQAELNSMQTVSKPEEIPDEELAELSVLESFDKERLKALIDKVIVYGADAIEIVWKVGNPFEAEITA